MSSVYIVLGVSPGFSAAWRCFFGSWRTDPGLIKVLIKCIYFDMSAYFNSVSISAILSFVTSERWLKAWGNEAMASDYPLI